MGSETVINIRAFAEREVKLAVDNLFSNELSAEAKELIIRCPQLVNKLAANLDKLIDNFDEPLEPIEISHVNYTQEQLGYEK